MERSDLKHIRLFLLDMDGTLYLGDRLFPFTVPLLHAIRSTGRSYRFLTNNSSKSVRTYVEKLRRLGIEANEPRPRPIICGSTTPIARSTSAERSRSRVSLRSTGCGSRRIRMQPTASCSASTPS